MEIMYSGSADAAESTITSAQRYVIQIQTLQAELDGLTITSTYSGGSGHIGINILGPTTHSQAYTDIKIKNCVIRHLGASNVGSYTYGIY